MYFSEQFAVTRESRDDWFDPILGGDTKLFVDPFLVFGEGEGEWADAHAQLIEHFNICFRLIAEGNRNPQSVPYKKALALLRFPEPREFRLGYTQVGTKGAGGGVAYARLIAAAMEDAIGRGLEDLRHFEELGVLNEGIGPDRISDLTCNILRDRFIKYTQSVVARHGIETRQIKMRAAAFDPSRLAWRSDTVEVPIEPETEDPILLVPERFLRDLPVLNADDWWENYEAEQLRTDMNYEVLGKVNKEEIVAAARRNPESVRAWSQRKEGTAGTPYDFESDPLGIWAWLREAKAFVKESPLVLTPPTDDEGFIQVIEQVVDRFRHFVEEAGGWRLLWNNRPRTEKPEEAAQLLLKGIAQSYCEANNIVIDREVDFGRGPVDFKFSNGYQQRAHLEVKKLHNGQFWNGLREQVPSYLRSDACDLGWFMWIRYRDEGISKTRPGLIAPLVTLVARENGLRLRSIGIDARPKPSASNI